MKLKMIQTLCLMLFCLPLSVVAQHHEKNTPAERLYTTGQQLFQQQAYAAAQPLLQAYLRQTEREGAPVSITTQRQEASYMLACIAYELKDGQCLAMLHNVLNENTDTPHANRLCALIASVHYYNKEYATALDWFQRANLDQLPAAERDDMTFRMAVSYLENDNPQEAAIWFETLRSTSQRYEADCTYYLSYIRYTQQRYDEALKGFAILQGHAVYGEKVPYYMAEIYLLQHHFDKAETMARSYLANRSDETHAAEMHRIVGSVQYHYGKYREAMSSFEAYRTGSREKELRRDALYMEGMSCYQCGVYSQVADLLGKVSVGTDALAQNACLHMGLAYLQMGNKTKARMTFEQAAALKADPQLTEQAAYNYAMCIHDTSYSAFGESVTVFEDFLNTYPQSVYADKVSDYLVDVYMSTRSYEAALQSIERIQSPTPQIRKAKARIQFQLGAQAFANAQFTQALDYFREAHRTASLSGNTANSILCEALYWEGESLYRLGEMSQAAQCFHNYLSATPERSGERYALAHYNLGYISFHRKDYNAAERYFTRFLQLGRQEGSDIMADACNRIADCCLQNRRFAEARQYYANAAAYQASSGDYSLYQMALVTGLQKDYNGKISLLSSLAVKYPQSPYNVPALYEKGRAYVQSNNNAQAIATFNELLQKYPESPIGRKAAAEIGMLHYQSGDYNRAIEAYKQVITRYPGSDEARLAMNDLKSIYVDANRVDEYAALMAQVPGGRQFDPSEQDSLTYLAAERIYMKGEETAARQSFIRYLQSYPDGAFSLDAHYRLCLIAQKEKNDDELLLHAGKLLEYPDSPYTEEALLMHGEILFKRQQYDEALTDYKLLQAKATHAEHRQLGLLGILRCSVLTHDDAGVVQAATALLSESKLLPERRDEALYDRAKAYINQKATAKANADLKLLAQDTRTLYGAEARYLLALSLYEAQDYAAAEKEILEFIEQSTPHAYWLARSFILLADIYMATDRPIDARQYLLSLQQNYQANDDIAGMIRQRLEKLDQTAAQQ